MKPRTTTPEEAIEWLNAELTTHAEQFGKRSVVLLEMIVGIRMFLGGMSQVFSDGSVIRILHVQCASVINSAVALAEFPPEQIELILQRATEISTGMAERLHGDGFVLLVDTLKENSTRH